MEQIFCSSGQKLLSDNLPHPSSIRSHLCRALAKYSQPQRSLSLSLLRCRLEQIVVSHQNPMLKQAMQSLKGWSEEVFYVLDNTPAESVEQ